MIYVANIKIGVASSHYKRKKKKKRKMWLAHVFGQKGAKNKIKLTKAGAHVFGQISYRFTVKKKKKKKKERNRT